MSHHSFWKSLQPCILEKEHERDEIYFSSAGWMWLQNVCFDLRVNYFWNLICTTFWKPLASYMKYWGSVFIRGVNTCHFYHLSVFFFLIASVDCREMNGDYLIVADYSLCLVTAPSPPKMVTHNVLLSFKFQKERYRASYIKIWHLFWVRLLIFNSFIIFLIRPHLDLNFTFRS